MTAAHRDQLTLPGMPQMCPYCGSRHVSPATEDAANQEDFPGTVWQCATCSRVWGQVMRSGA